MPNYIYPLIGMNAAATQEASTYVKVSEAPLPSDIITPQTLQAWLNQNALSSTDSNIYQILIEQATTACLAFLNKAIFSTTYQAIYNAVTNAYQLTNVAIIDLTTITLSYNNGNGYTPYVIGNSIYTDTSILQTQYMNMRRQVDGTVTITLNPASPIQVFSASDNPPVFITYQAGYTSAADFKAAQQGLYNDLVLAILNTATYNATYRGDQGLNPAAEADYGIPAVAKKYLTQHSKRYTSLGGQNKRNNPQLYFNQSTNNT